MTRKVYQHIASALQAMRTCQAKAANDANAAEWADRHETTIKQLIKRYLPSGSGIDCGTLLDFTNSKPNRLVLIAPFHHMNVHGYYDGWTDHTVIVTPDLAFGFDLKITGRDRNDIKEYLADTFHHGLSADVDAAALAAEVFGPKQEQTK